MKRFLTIIVSCILLFVVVCPITPTPIAVPGGKAHAMQAPMIAMVAIIVLLPVNSEHPLWNASSFDIPNASSVNIVDLTCSRLC